MAFRGYAVYARGVRVRHYTEEGDDLSPDHLCVDRQLWPARYPLGIDHLAEANAAFIDPETWDEYRSECGLPPLG
jgi:hypothetical protein